MYDCVMSYQLMSSEKFTNVQKIQSGLTKIFRSAEKSDSFYRVMRNDESLGFLVPNDVWQSLIEDLDALSSQSYLSKVYKARISSKRYSAKQVRDILNIA